MDLPTSRPSTHYSEGHGPRTGRRRGRDDQGSGQGRQPSSSSAASFGLLNPLALVLVLLLLQATSTAAVGATATASTLVLSKPGPGGRSSDHSSSASGSGSGSDRDSPADAAAEQASASLASALLPSSGSPPVNSKAAPAAQLHLVEVYENQRWTALGGWQRPSGEGKVRPWTYEDGGESLDPQRLRLPDGFEWCGSWRVLRTNGTDAKGWRYANRAQSFDSHHSGRRQRILSDRARRRRWVRPMRRAAAGAEGQAGEGAGVRQLRSVLLQGEIDLGRDMQDGSAAGKEAAGGKAGGEALLLLLGEEGMAGAELLAPPDRLDAVGAEALGDGPLGNLLLLGHAVQSAARHAQEGFCFKGFWLTFVKSLARRDFGFCFGIPMTPNFPSLERLNFLPTINTNVGVFYPFTLSGWCSISYPADLVFRLLAKVAPHVPTPSPDEAAAGTRSRYAATRAATAAAMADARRGLVATATAARARAKAAAKGLKVAASGPKKQKKGGRRRRGSVERVGISISCRYNPSTGFFVRVTPWLFILPGLQLLARLLARLFNFLLGRVEEFEARTRRRATAPAPAPTAAAATAEPEAQEKQEQTPVQEQVQQQLLASAYGRRFKKWLSKKTSGLGFSMALYKSGLGASVLVSLSPFFFGLRRPARPAIVASATALGSAQLLMDDAAAPPVAVVAEPSIMMKGSVSQPPLEPPPAAGKEGEEGDDEIPIPVLAGGQEEEAEEGGRKGAASDDDKGRATGAGAGGMDTSTSQRDGTPTSFSPGAGSRPDQQDGTSGGGLGEEAAGANTIGVA